MFGERLSFNQKIVGTVYNFCWKNLSFLFVNIHFTVHYFTALCNSVNNHFTDLCLFFYFNYLNFLCVKVKSRMKPRFSHKLSATMIYYSHSAIRNIFTPCHLTMITTEILARFMLEIWNLLCTFYNDRYYKIVCDTELDDHIHFRVDAKYIGARNIHREKFYNSLGDICDLFDNQKFLGQSRFEKVYFSSHKVQTIVKY